MQKKSRYQALQDQYAQQLGTNTQPRPQPPTLPPNPPVGFVGSPGPFVHPSSVGLNPPTPYAGNTVAPPAVIKTPSQPPPLPRATPTHAPLPVNPTQAPQTTFTSEQSASLDPRKLPNPTKGYSPVDVAEVEVPLIYYDTQQGELPPRPDLDFVVSDTYNASPRFTRMSMYSLPTTKDLCKSSKIPLAMTLQPFAEPGIGEIPVPLVDMGPDGPIRCSRCRAYINPFVTFTNNGSKYTCGFCGMSNDVPPAYFSPLLGTQRQDINERFELLRGSVDFVATQAYITKEPKPITYLFVLDTSHSAVQSGIIESFSLAMQRLLPSVFLESNSRIGFITYDHTVSFYNIHPSQKQPQMVVVPDVTQLFLPLPESSLIVKYKDAQSNIDTLVNNLPTTFGESVAGAVCTGAVLKIAAKALSGMGGGKILLFTACLPNTGPGILKKRDANLESDKEKLLFKPQSEYYTKLAEVCAKHSVSVDLFIGAGSYIDITTLSEVPRATGGQVYYYPSFTKHLHQEQLYRELYRNLTREAGYDGLLRLRCSQGLNLTKEHGYFSKFSESDLTMPHISADSTIAFEFEYEDTLKEDRGALFQIAILFTTKDGNRRIRVHNLKVGASDTLTKVFKSADLDVVLNILVRQNTADYTEYQMPELRKQFVNRMSQILAAYRRHCAKGAHRDGQLILPDSLKLLPIYSLGLLKLPLMGPLRGGTQFHSLPDTRAYYKSIFDTVPLRDLSPLAYPLLFEIHNMSRHPFHGILKENGFVQFPGQCRLNKENLHSHGIYLLDNYHRLYLWIGSNADKELVDQLIPEEYQNVDPNILLVLPRAETDLSTRVFNLLNSNRLQRSLSPEIYILRQGSNLEQRLLKYMVEDGMKGVRDVKDMNYIDFLCHVHRCIQAAI